MRCDDVASLLLRRLEERLEPEEGRRLDRHLAACERCREIPDPDTQQRVAALLSARPRVDAPLGFAGRVLTHLEAGPDPGPGWLELLNWRAWTVRLAPVAGALAVVAALGFGPTEAAEPLEFSDLVAGWVIEEEPGEMPSVSLLWQEDTAAETLLEAVLTAVPDERRSTPDPQEQE